MVVLAIVMRPFSPNTIDPGIITFSSSAAAATTTFIVDPGSYVSVKARLRQRSGVNAVTAFGSNRGLTAIARIAPVCGSITMIVPAFARALLTASSNSFSAIY